MSHSAPANAREGALAKLVAEAARFAEPASEPVARPAAIRSVEALAPPAIARQPDATPPSVRSAHGGYVPVAVAPERGNTRPVVPVDGRLHMRVAAATLEELDRLVAGWKQGDPAALRDLERATVVRIGIAMVLADVRLNGPDGAVGEAVRAALDPAVRHTDRPMPALERWIRSEPDPMSPAPGGAGSPGTAVFASRSPD